MRSVALLLVLLAAVQAAGALPGGISALAGAGWASEAGCPPRSLQVTVSGTQVAPGAWVFVSSALNTAPACTLPFPPAFALPFEGPWSAAGGCVPSAVLDPVIERWLCLQDPHQEGTFTTYAFNVCATATVACTEPGSVDVVLVEAPQ
jgi:hypothetical protein